MAQLITDTSNIQIIENDDEKNNFQVQKCSGLY